MGTFFFRAAFAACFASHVGEPSLLSLVCHSPSGSTSTSSTLSGVCCRILSKYLSRINCHHQRSFWCFRTTTNPSTTKSSGFNTFSQTGHSQVVVCSMMEYHDVASKHCGCTHLSDRDGTLIRM